MWNDGFNNYNRINHPKKEPELKTIQFYKIDGQNVSVLPFIIQKASNIVIIRVILANLADLDVFRP